jgi:cyclase
MLTKRVIPCLDVKDGRVVKGVRFLDLRDAGDPVEIARRYDDQEADELCFLDITASVEGREALLAVVRRTADAIFIPLTVGGGIDSVDRVRRLLEAGADKISLNTAAVLRPALIAEAAVRAGSQSVVVAIDVRRGQDGWEVFTHGGRKPTGLNAIEWARQAVEQGAGELLITSMDRDGTGSGYDLELIEACSAAVTVPIIASGGAGSIEDIATVLAGPANAALAASVFHFGSITVSALKRDLLQRGIAVRPPTHSM